MKFTDFPNGAKFPLLGLGMWQMTDPNSFEQVIDQALEIGYRHFDTAYLYDNEVEFGKVLKKWFDSGKLKREELFITTKLPWHGVEKSRVPHFLKLSLEKLQLSYVDLYLIHTPTGLKYISDTQSVGFGPDGNVLIDPTTDLIAVWKAMEEQAKAGLARAIGVSNFNCEQLERVYNAATIKPVCNQVEFHAYFQQRQLMECCKKLNVQITGYGNLGSPGRTDMYSKYGKEFKGPELLSDKVVMEIARKHSKTSAQVLLRFLVQLGVACIPKASSAKRLKENFDIFNFELDGSDMEQLKGLDRGEAGRSFTMKDILKGLEKHPEFFIKN